MSDDLYHQLILDHFQDPLNSGEIANPDAKLEEGNASCGDLFTFYVKFIPHLGGEYNRIDHITFTGQGCAISTAACSMLTETLKGKSLAEIPELNLEYMQQLIGVEVSHARHKCLMLPARALIKALTDTNSTLKMSNIHT